MRKFLAALLLATVCGSGVFAQSVVNSGQVGSPVQGVPTGGGATPNIQLVQTPAVISTISASTTGTQAFGAANTGGNLLIALVQLSVGSSGNTVTVTDSNGNSWFQAGSRDIGISQIWYAPFAKAGANTVTATMNAASTGALAIAEYSGHYAPHPLINTFNPIASGGGVVPASYAVSPVAGSLVISMFSSNGAATNWSNFSGCTMRTTNLTGTPLVWGDGITVANTTYRCSGVNNTNDFIGKAAVFAPATYTVSTVPTLTRQGEGQGALTDGQILGVTATSPATETIASGMVGEVMMVIVQQTGAADNITGVTDTQGNVYTRISGFTALTSCCSAKFYSIYTAPVVIPSLAVNTVSVAFSASSLQFAAVGFSGLTNVLDTTSTTGVGTSSTITAAAAGELVITSLGNVAASWSNLSGTDIFGFAGALQLAAPNNSFNSPMEVNYKVGIAGSNSLTGTSNQGNNSFYNAAFRQGALPR